jgi:hypothetical protein
VRPPEDDRPKDLARPTVFDAPGQNAISCL